MKTHRNIVGCIF